MPLSKAQTLLLLAESQSSAFVVDPFIAFSVAEWRTSPTRISKLVQERSRGELVAVRSSATIEDADPDLPPGLFYSELGVDSSDGVHLTTAIERVIESFNRHERARSAGDANEIIVQGQLVGARMSGVLSTGPAHDLYFSVYYNDESDRTDSVTAGYACKRADVLREAPSLAEPWSTLRQTVLAVEALLTLPLLVEFGVSATGQVHVFQARANHQETRPPTKSTVRRVALNLLKAARSEIAARSEVWSDMSDWNPGEMLGDRPRPLAVSLYQYLVTNDAWIRGRSSLGYRRVTPSVLVETLAGKPYVNVRRSFLSLTPAHLPRELAERLVEDRLQALTERPELHDKVELQLLFTVADVTSPGRTACLLERGFSRSEVEEIDSELRALTSSAIAAHASFHQKDAELVSRLVDWSPANRPERDEADLERLRRFVCEGLAKCRDDGVVPFARQARLAFIARDLLGRFTVSRCVDEQWYENWWRSLDTVATKVASAFVDVSCGRLSRPQFDATFGHLRARTYDICSPRYDQIRWLPIHTASRLLRKSPTTLNSREQDRMAAGLAEAGLSLGSDEFLDFARSAMRAREDIKFSFSSVVSDILEVIAALGDVLGFSREDMSFLTVQDLTNPTVEGVRHEHLRSCWQTEIKNRREAWTAGLRLVLSDFIAAPEDLLIVRQRSTRPNFVTKAAIEAEVVALSSPSPDPAAALKGRIVAVEAADPGFDWIFAFGIAGLITRYGGAASHMAIRCAEFGIPAAIGCGEEIFQRVVRSKRVLLDCADGRIDVVEAVGTL